MSNKQKSQSPLLLRREFLVGSAAVAAFAAVPAVYATARKKARGVRALSLQNTHTGEKTRVDYWIDGRYQPEALAEIDMILRDHRDNEVCSIDTRLIDLLYNVNQKTVCNSAKCFEILSGYRSPNTNRMLRNRRRGSGVAKNSLHMMGKAIDIKLPGVGNSNLFHAATAQRTGGVGYYGSSFVHLDVGKVRTWGRRRRA
ncbi:MAG TPA: hypothetical protein DDW45_04265 [Gammaproteobacteria bacterium]|nr:hypothetical protein [Gammaproteobacteria bacterium]